MSASIALEGFAPRRHAVSAGLQRLGLLYVWVTVAIGAIVFSEPAPYDLLMLGAAVLLPVLGLTRFTRGLGLYLILWAVVVASGLMAVTQAGVLSEPAKHMGITLYLALSSAVMVGFVSQRPDRRVRLIMSAYMLAALVAATAALIGYFDLAPGAFDLFTEYGRARGTFKDPNVLGAFLVPALLYGFNAMMTARVGRAAVWALTLPILLLGTLLSFSRGAWINLAVSLIAYAYFSFGTVSSHLQRLKLVACVLLAVVLATSVFLAAKTIPQVADILGERASFEQSYDVGPEGRFGGQEKAVSLIASHPLGIGALEFARVYHSEDAHEVYLSMFLNAGWLGGLVYLAIVLLTVLLGFRQVFRDRGGDGISVVLAASFFGMVLEGLVIDSDHWRHFYLLMAMIWGMALAPQPAHERAAAVSGRRSPDAA